MRPSSFVLSVLIFCIAFFAGLIYNVALRSNEVTFVFDSAHYLHSASALVDYIKEGAHLAPERLADLSAYVRVDGPILPLIGACSFLSTSALLQKWQGIVFVQSFIHGLSAVLVFLLTRKLSRSSVTGFAAGAAFAVYLSGIIAAGRFLTETLTAGIVLLLVYLFTCSVESANENKKNASILAALLGIFGGILFLVKAALLPAVFTCGLISLYFLRSWKKRGVWFVCLVIGVILPVAGWLAASKSIFHHASLFPERSAGLNVAAGTDIESDGWSAMPLPPLFELNYSDSPAHILYGTAWNHKMELASLLTKKMARLFAYPWNDFNQTVFGFGTEAQILIHQVLLMLSFCGILLFIARAGKPNGAKWLIAWYSIAIIAGHCVFIPFETIARYAYPATPFMFILAAIFLSQLLTSRPSAKIRFALCVLSIAFIVFSNLRMEPYLLLCGIDASQSFALTAVIKLVFCLAFLAAAVFATAKIEAGSFRRLSVVAALLFLSISTMIFLQWRYGLAFTEWPCKMEPGTVLSRTTLLPDNNKNAIVWAALLVDGDNDIEKLQFKLNGRVLEGKAIPIWYVPNSYRYQATLLHVIKTEAEAEGVGIDAFRQWRVIPVPLSLLKSGAQNTIELSSVGASATVYGDYFIDKRIRLPHLQAFSVPCRQNNHLNHDGRISGPISYAFANTYCRLQVEGIKESGDLSSSSGLQTGGFRVFLLAARGFNVHPDQNPAMRFVDCFVSLY